MFRRRLFSLSETRPGGVKDRREPYPRGGDASEEHDPLQIQLLPRLQGVGRGSLLLQPSRHIPASVLASSRRASATFLFLLMPSHIGLHFSILLLLRHRWRYGANEQGAKGAGPGVNGVPSRQDRDPLTRTSRTLTALRGEKHSWCRGKGLGRVDFPRTRHQPIVEPESLGWSSRRPGFSGQTRRR